MNWDQRVPDKAPFWAPPLLALQFLTRVPVPVLDRLSAVQVQTGLTAAIGWFPLVGAFIGVITASVVSAGDALWSRPIAVIIALIVEARLTGAFHEDAVADFCDAFGGGHTAEQVRAIMKDSRIGSYGALGLGLAVLLRAALLVSLEPPVLIAAIVASACFGRLVIVLAMLAITPAPVGTGLARDIGGAIGRHQLAVGVLAALPGLLPLVFARPLAVGAAMIAASIFLVWFRALLLRRIGGSTGDCLGFAAYAGQLLLLLAVVAF